MPNKLGGVQPLCKNGGLGDVDIDRCCWVQNNMQSNQITFTPRPSLVATYSVPDMASDSGGVKCDVTGTNLCIAVSFNPPFLREGWTPPN